MDGSIFGARIGSAAFALGLGWAVASSPGVAVADESDAGSASSPDQSSASSNSSGASAQPASPQRSRPSAGPARSIVRSPSSKSSSGETKPVAPRHLRQRVEHQMDTDIAPAASVRLGDDTVATSGAPAAVVPTSITPTRQIPFSAPAQLSSLSTSQPGAVSTSIGSGLLSMLGFGPSRNGTSVPTSPMEVVTAALSLIGREIDRLFVSQSPVPAAAAAVSKWQSLFSVALPSVSIASASTNEGNSGTTNLGFTVTLSKASSTPVTVNYATSNGTATAGQDYTSSSGTITFAAGQTSKTVNVAVAGDSTVESNETFTVTLSTPSGATISRASATGTIKNDDVAPPTVSIAGATKTEGNSGTTNLGFVFTLSKASSTPVTVNYATSDGTATAGTDYVANSGTVTFAAGQTSKTVNVTVNGDTTAESDETLTMTLFGASGATIANAVATGTIRNDDAALPTIAIADASRSEGAAGTSNLGFTVTLSKASSTSVTVNYATSNGTATAGTDYVSSSGTVTFAAGQMTKTVNVAVNGDATVESDETFTVMLSAPSGATISRAAAIGTIVNDDTATVPGDTGQPAVPFGSHTRPYASGTLLPTGSQATLDSAVVSLYNKWKANFLVSAGSYGLAVKADADYPYVSEAQGYGMELTVLMAGADPAAQTSFDGILKYVLAHPSSINPDLHASEQNASFVSVNGKDSATDGDMSIAYALLLADKQWGSAGTYNYKQLAVTRINAIKASEMNPTTFLPTLGDWSSSGDSYYNSTRPSDFMIDHFRAFKAATNDTFWDSAVAATSNLVTQQQNTYAPSTGLVADFVVNTNGTPKPAPANYLESSTDGQYSYNAVRVPWHIGTDAVVYGDAASKAQAEKITAWFRAKTGDTPSKVVSGYKLDGTAVVTYLDPEFVALLGPAAMTNPANQAWLDKIWTYTVAQSLGSAAKSYYSASLMLQAMIVMSGNYWAP